MVTPLQKTGRDFPAGRDPHGGTEGEAGPPPRWFVRLGRRSWGWLRGLSRRRIALLLLTVALAAVLVVKGGERLAAFTRTSFLVYGNVDIREVDLGFRVPGRIAAILKDEGDRVAAGEPVARLDRAPYLAARDQAAAELEVRIATLQTAETTFQRDKILVESHAVSRQEFENAMGARNEATANVALAEARLAAARIDLDDTEILAPSDGLVTIRAREPGTVVAAGDILLTVSVDRPVWVRAYLAEPDLGRVYPGKPVVFFNDTSPRRLYHGQIGYVAPRAEFTPKPVETPELRTSLVYRIRIVVADPDPGLRQGMPVTVRIGLP